MTAPAPAAAPDADLEQRWAAWLITRNRTGARIAIALTVVIYPLFAILDWLVVPPQWWTLLIATRVVVTVGAFVHLAVLRTAFWERHWRVCTSAHALVLSAGIVVMVVAIGGFPSGYYAGISLTMLGGGLLFVWPHRQAIATYSGIVMGYVFPCAAIATIDDWFAGSQNLFFLVATATVVSASHGFVHKSAKEQLAGEIALERTKATLERAHEQLKQLDRFKSQFFANITHELKTPLAMILSPLELMLGGDLGRLDDEQRGTMDAMFRSGMKLLKLVQDLLDLSKLEESRLHLRVTGCDLVAFLHDLVAQAEPLARRKKIELSFEADAESCLAWCDPERLERVFVNLLSNAAKFTPEGGHIRVSAKSTPTQVLVSVADDGPGFAADMAERVFERFFQIDMAGTRRYGGAGIGLALAKELVELHGGRIWAESEQGKGATFRVQLHRDVGRLPPGAIDRRVESRDVADGKRSTDRSISDWSVQLAARADYRLLDIAEVTERRVVLRDSGAGQRTFTVLVVEDTPDVIRLVNLSLHREFRVVAAENGARGLELALRDPPHLVVTDFMMPAMDGMELTRRLRADPRTGHIPIVMLTARGDLDDRVAGLQSGVNAYLAKPFSPRELLTTVRGLLKVQDSQADLLLRQKMDSLVQLAGGLAHEINNPLNYIKNSVGILRKDAETVEAAIARAGTGPVAPEDLARLERTNARIRKMVETAEAGVRRIAGTVELMRKYSREGYTRAMAPLDAFAAARDVVAMVLPATGRDVRVETTFQGDGTVDCVAEEFHQVLSNLVQNAVEACQDGTGLVHVTGRGEADRIVLVVRDNGSGMSPEVRQQIFTPFFTTKEPGRGMGLGLTIVWRFVTALGGSIEVQSDAGAGTAFTLRLSRRAADRATTDADAVRAG